MHNNSIAHNPIFMSHIHSTILYFKSNINLQRQCNQIKSQSGANQRLKSALQHFNTGVSENSMPLLPLFWRSVNPIPIRGTGYTQHIITAPLQIFRPSAVSEYPHVAWRFDKKNCFKKKKKYIPDVVELVVPHIA